MKNFLLVAAFLVCTGCGGGGSNIGGGGGVQPAEIAGKWEILATSATAVAANLPNSAIETNLTQAGTTVFADVQSTFVLPFDLQGIRRPIAPLNPCGGLPVATISGTLSGQNLSFTLTESGPGGTYIVTGTATVRSDNQTIAGNYSAAAACGLPADAGTLTGSLVPSISGIYSTMYDTVTPLTLSVTEDAIHNVTTTGTYQGSSFTLSGIIIGGGLTLSGDITGMGQVILMTFYLNFPLVSIMPSVNGNPTRAGDFLIFWPDGSMGLATKQ